ncbi:MAG: NAD-dependent succinate-semialdehyde dehydrogenase [Ectothiorhodospiraceae bacterium]|nr:NAD-dependent succinate-semialdehyde dehydrogenase [Ectothiorhodospiraceae bacterium]
MTYQTTNPATDELVERFASWTEDELESALAQVSAITPLWAATPLPERCRLLNRLAEVIRGQQESLAQLVSLEMGKLIAESRAEVEKCALGCEFYAAQAATFLADERVETDARKSLVVYQPIGTVLAVMPWNFPLWQVFRFVAPTLAAGNTGLLKHASNVPQCALAIERLVQEAGFPDGVFRTLMIDARDVEGVIADARVQAVTLTGSEPAGRSVGAAAGKHLKKSVLELGGSDAFVVLEDADLEHTVQQAVVSRFMNCGQSCIAAKRFIVVEDIAEAFVSRFVQAVQALNVGDPVNETTTLAPMARPDLRDELHTQVQASIAAGAVLVTGGEPVAGPGAYYQATILDQVAPGMVAYEQELFGPVASVIRVADEAQALAVSNASRFGLGGSVWTQDSERGERFARQMQCGSAFVNGLVKSDPRLPFGGIKASGYGRELSHHGLREFVNAKTLWVR